VWITLFFIQQDIQMGIWEKGGSGDDAENREDGKEKMFC
jgi:hypothetical protein